MMVVQIYVGNTYYTTTFTSEWALNLKLADYKMLADKITVNGEVVYEK